jgi:hypothetical protein
LFHRYHDGMASRCFWLIEVATRKAATVAPPTTTAAALRARSKRPSRNAPRRAMSPSRITSSTTPMAARRMRNR